jgi:hypothetical protein
MEAVRAFYAGALGLPLEGDASYLHTTAVNGAKHLALWPLSAAAQSCFGRDSWPRDLPVPQGWLEFDVDDMLGQAGEPRWERTKRGQGTGTNGGMRSGMKPGTLVLSMLQP